MNRKIYKSKVEGIQYRGDKPFEWTVPEWECPICRISQLELVEDSLKQVETAASYMRGEYNSFDEYVHKYSYSFSLYCQNKDCREIVFCIGYGEGELFSYSSADEKLEDFQAFEVICTPLFFVPNLVMFTPPSATPEKVQDLLNDSFKLFFANPYASANQVRRATEQLLTEQGVNRFTYTKPDDKTGKRKRKELNLHSRIEKFRKQHKNLELEELLKALKHLGNAGSHTSKEVTHDDVLDSYEFMEYVLRFLYKKPDLTISKAKKVNRNKGPISKSKKL